MLLARGYVPQVKQSRDKAWIKARLRSRAEDPVGEERLADPVGARPLARDHLVGRQQVERLLDRCSEQRMLSLTFGDTPCGESLEGVIVRRD
ncbi:MAG TPA: hypothetical protein VNP89_04425 [Gaiellaceae bacterium]|nr:hypothetical protein [Gaiellaceae bacterium]